MSHENEYQIKGTVISFQEYKDYDGILRVLTESKGKMSFYAKNIRKSNAKSAVRAELFDYGTIHYKTSRGGLPFLQKESSFRAPFKLRNHIGRFVGASFICEVIDHVTNDSNPEDSLLYIVLREALETLGELETHSEILQASYGFARRALIHTGILSELFPDTGSPKQLGRLANTITNYSERELKTLNSIQVLISKNRNTSKQHS